MDWYSQIPVHKECVKSIRFSFHMLTERGDFLHFSIGKPFYLCFFLWIDAQKLLVSCETFSTLYNVLTNRLLYLHLIFGACLSYITNKHLFMYVYRTLIPRNISCYLSMWIRIKNVVIYSEQSFFAFLVLIKRNT